MAETSDNKALVKASFDRWSAGQGSPFELLLPESDWTIVGSSPLSKTYTSRQAFLEDSAIQCQNGDTAGADGAWHLR